MEQQLWALQGALFFCSGPLFLDLAVIHYISDTDHAVGSKRTGRGPTHSVKPADSALRGDGHNVRSTTEGLRPWPRNETAPVPARKSPDQLRRRKRAPDGPPQEAVCAPRRERRSVAHPSVALR
jgi:hypothetical protein